MDSPTTGRKVNVAWNSWDVDWGTADPKQWTVEITPPAGGTLVANQCANVTESDSGNDSCTFTGSVDGTYSVKVTAAGSTDSATATIAVKQIALPGKPRDVKVLPGPNELVVSWNPPADLGGGVGGYHVEALVENAQASGPNCETTTELTCTVKGLTAGTSYQILVFAISKQDPDYISEPAKSDFIKVPGTVAGTPTPPASVPPSAGKLTAPSTSLTPNQAVTLSGSGYAAYTPIQIVVYSAPQILKTVTTDGSGAFSTSVTLPAGLTGSHTLVAGGVGPDGAYRYLTLPITAGTAGLPVTGQSTPKLVVTALVVLALGVVLVRVTRRRSI
ncbi:fibronectin type III domain-containing protein [Planosporangium sp. 12N6]|uniref:fibronectin type III domain-containing protein n=1 Tax=Planosporangium spinosum TaxID=3402278 RepID=UPI003CEF279C